MKQTNLMALDLEMNQPSNTIIQVGVAIGSLETRELLHVARFYVHTEEIISPVITTLTGITQERVAQGEHIKDVVREIYALHKDYDCFTNPVTWGGGDPELLRSQAGIVDDWIFGRRWIDVKTIHLTMQLAKGQQTQGGLAKAITRHGLEFQGRKHDAAHDAANTLRLYFKILEQLK